MHEAPAKTRPDIKPIAPADSTAICAMMARAFFDDPVMMHLFADDAVRTAKLPKLFALYLKMGLAHKACFMSAGGESAALWRPPNAWHIPFWQYVVHGPALLNIFGGGTLNVIKTLDEVEKLHPKIPHWYLQVLATDPAKQGKGFASAVMRQQLAVADAARMPCYLESSKETNIPVYRAFGFDVTGEIKLPGGGPTVWPMWRNAHT